MAELRTQPRIQTLTDRLSQQLLGKEPQIRIFVATVLGGGSVLLVDRPGVGKTTLAKAYAAAVDREFARVQGTSDLLPSDLTGVTTFDPATGQWRFHPGPLASQVVLVDEVNRIPPRSQSGLLEALAEGQVTADGTTYPIADGFTVVATANPDADAGTFPILGGLADRFTVALTLGLPDRRSARAVALRQPHDHAETPVLSGTDLQELRSTVDNVELVDAVTDYCLDLVDKARSSGWLSPRAAQALVQTARGVAVLAGRDHVRPEDVQLVAPVVLAHRFGDAALSDLPAAQAQVTNLVETMQAPVPGR